MRIFKTKTFVRFSRKALVDDSDLCKAIEAANRGVVDADLGGGVIKQRIARRGEGKSGGFRTLVLFKIGERGFFVYGFAKNERDNIRDDELAALKKLASEMLAYNDDEIEKALVSGALVEVIENEEQAIQ